MTTRTAKSVARSGGSVARTTEKSAARKPWSVRSARARKTPRAEESAARSLWPVRSARARKTPRAELAIMIFYSLRLGRLREGQLWSVSGWASHGRRRSHARTAHLAPIILPSPYLTVLIQRCRYLVIKLYLEGKIYYIYNNIKYIIIK